MQVNGKLYIVLKGSEFWSLINNQWCRIIKVQGFGRMMETEQGQCGKNKIDRLRNQLSIFSNK